MHSFLAKKPSLCYSGKSVCIGSGRPGFETRSGYTKDLNTLVVMMSFLDCGDCITAGETQPPNHLNNIKYKLC